MAEISPPVMRERPSFIKSTLSGMEGAIKGLLTGGIIGVSVGAVIALGVAAVLPMESLLPTVAETVGEVVNWGATALLGATIGGSTLGAVGAVSGLVTGVVKSRERNQPAAEDIVNVAKISFAQGVQVGTVQTIQQVQQVAQLEQQMHAKKDTKWQDKVKKDKEFVVAEQQVIN